MLKNGEKIVYIIRLKQNFVGFYNKCTAEKNYMYNAPIVVKLFYIIYIKYIFVIFVAHQTEF